MGGFARPFVTVMTNAQHLPHSEGRGFSRGLDNPDGSHKTSAERQGDGLSTAPEGLVFALPDQRFRRLPVRGIFRTSLEFALRYRPIGPAPRAERSPVHCNLPSGSSGADNAARFPPRPRSRGFRHENQMTLQDETRVVDDIVARGRDAQREFESRGSQNRYDRAATAAGWAIMEPSRNRMLAEMAVETTGLGNVADKIVKNHRKTLGLLRDIAGVQTFGVVKEDPELRMTEIARPVGLIGSVVPSTNPAATPANNIINSLKCGNAIVISPSPKGSACCNALLEFVHSEFDRIGENRDLIQMIPSPGSKVRTQRLLETADLAIVTGSQDNVRRAYSSGTPAIGVGVGNVPAIVDESADLAKAAARISQSKCFDNATSCSSESALLVVDDVYDDFCAALRTEGGAIVPRAQEQEIVDRIWPDGSLNQGVMARDADIVIRELGLEDRCPASTRFVVVETEGIGPGFRLSEEKLSRVAALYRCRDFSHALELTGRILDFQGTGHSVSLHSRRDDRTYVLAKDLPTCRVIVNQAHCFATGGSFENGMPFSLSMGCGSWGRNSIDDNLHWRHFMQRTRIVRPIESREPALEDVFGPFWTEFGK